MILMWKDSLHYIRTTFKAGFELSRENWRNAWSNFAFRTTIISALIFLLALLIFTYFFFDYIEYAPGGAVLNDWLLKRLPAINVSVLIVFFEASVVLLFLTRSVAHPEMFIVCLVAIVFILLSRIITIDITKLNPPIGLIELKDPIADIVYKSGFIKRDLFYSGHTAILCVIYLCLNNKGDKHYTLVAIIMVGFLLLIQHVHYTVDVISAPFFALGCYTFSTYLLRLLSVNK